MKKRILSALLAIVMILSIVPVAFAEEVVLPGGATEWNAEQSENTVTDGVNYWATLDAAVKAIDSAKQVGAVLYCKPGADVGILQHTPVCSTLTIYGNGATVAAGGERDFDIGNTDPNGGRDVTADMTLTVYDLNGCGAWGTKATEHTVNLVFIGCKDMGKVYLFGTAGTLNITLTDCSFTSNDNGGGDCKVYSNANGAIELTRVDFSNVDKAVNLNHKVAGVQTVSITDCSFTDCGDDVAADEIPVRVLSSVEGGKSVLNVSGASFSGTPEGGADILLDYGAGMTAAKIAETAANVLFMESDTEGETKVLETTDTEEFRNYVPVAFIGEAEFTSLQDAIDETAKAPNTYEIKLAPGVIEDEVIITQTPGVYLTITGAPEGTTLKGMIIVNGQSKGYDNQSVTIDNVDIEATGTYCINIPANYRYSKNLTVKNCDFTGEGAVGINQATGGCKNWLIQNCTADETMHSLIQVKNVEGLVIDGCTVRSEEGINLNSSSNVEIKNSTVEVRGYAVRAGVSDGTSGAITLTKNTLKTNSEEDAVVVLRGSAVTGVELNMENNVVSGETHISGTAEETNITADNNYWDGKEDPVVNGAPVDVNSYYEDENLEDLAGDPAQYAAQIGNDLYETVEAAMAAVQSNDELKLLRDLELKSTLTLNKGFSFTLNGDGHKITSDGATNTALMVGDTTYTVDNADAPVYTLKDIVFDGWTTDHVVRVQGVNAVVEDCTFQNCVQLANGLAPLSFNYSFATVKDCVFKSNTAAFDLIDINSWSDGSQSAVTIEGCEFIDNNCPIVGAIYYHCGSAFELKDCEFVGNECALAPVFLGLAGANDVVSGCTFTENVGSKANGVFVEGKATLVGVDDALTNAEAKIGEMYYEKFAEAFAAVGEEDTLTLLKEIELEEALVLDGAYAINGVKPNGTIELLDGATLTAPEGWDVTANVEGKAVVYADGTYVLKNLYTVTYTDGVEGEEIFKDQTAILVDGSATPSFDGKVEREGYLFAGWSPAIAEKVTEDVTYVATYKKIPAFEDIEEGKFYTDAAIWGTTFGIVKGVEEGVFAPEVMCTRAQVVTFLWRAAGSPKASADTEVSFADIEETSYYYDAVVWAVENGITNGVSATEFAPEAVCTRAQVVTFLWRAAGEPKAEAEMSFDDVAEGTYYYDAVLWAAENKITNGVSATKFAPANECTRAQAITLIFRAFN